MTGQVHQTARVAGTAVVADDFRLGELSRIGEFSFVRDRVIVGSRTSIGSFVGLEGDIVIGDDVSIQSGCHITRGVRIGDLAFLGPRVVTMNDRRMVYRRSVPFVPAPPIIGRAARIGGASALLPGCRIGENAFVSAGSVVSGDVPPATIVAGNPARVVGEVPRSEWL
jgi:UDP-2-acetamido-3-amino-2,3-dideoxy-glucuronate N-acetyltransferase